MAGEDDDDFETDMDGNAGQTAEDDDTDDGDQETDDPAELKKRLAKTTAALKKANAQAAKLRTAKKVPAKKAAPAAREDDDTEGSQVATAVERLEAKHRSQAIRREGAAAILEAGFQGSRQEARDLTRLFDLDELDVDDDGDVDGLDDAVAELKERYPALFATKQVAGGRQQRHRVPGIDANAGRTGGRADRTESKSSAERIGALLRRGA